MMRWNRILCLLLCAALLALSACSSAGDGGESAADDPFPALEEDAVDYAAEAALVLELLAAGEFAEVAARADESIAEQVSESSLADAWLGEAAELGALREATEVAVTPHGDGSLVQLVGEFVNGQLQLTLFFTAEGRISGIFFANLSREEEPVEGVSLPLPDGAQEVEVLLFEGGEMELRGLLLLPAGYSAGTPVVVFAQGSGASDLDEAIGPNRPFRDIAYGFAELGIASIRFDKLPYSHPELFAGPDYTADLEYTRPVLEALRVAREAATLGDAYLLGHSLGGMLTPYLIEQSAGGFAGGLVFAGSPRPLWEISHDQNALLLDLLEGELYDGQLAFMEGELEKAGRLDAMGEDELLAETVFGLPAYYLRHMGGIDTLALVAQNGVPMFIAHAEADFQVTDKDFAAWREGLAGQSDVTLRSYAGLNHLFMPLAADLTNYYEVYNTPMTVDEAVILDAGQWILAQQG